MKSWLPYGIVTALAVVFTAGYTSDLEMAWLAAMLAVPVVGFGLGGLVGLVWKFSRGMDWQGVLALIVFSVVLNSGLMVEEMSVGLIRNSFDRYADQLREVESAQAYHEVDLGAEKQLYFSSGSDTYRLNFNHQGRQSLTKTDIVEMTNPWLQDRGYGPARISVALYPPSYRKDVFSIKKVGSVSITAKLQHAVERHGQKIDTFFLSLTYSAGMLHVEETGWVAVFDQ